MEHTANKMEKKWADIIIIKVVCHVLYTLKLWRQKLYAVSIKCINCKRETGLNSETSFSRVFDEVINKSVLNAIFHNVFMSWIISSNQETNYEMDENNHQY